MILFAKNATQFFAKTLILAWLVFACLICGQTALAADSMGRLFTSPAERNNLDYLRQTKKKLIVTTPTEQPTIAREPAPIELPDAVNLQGYVKRNDGKDSTVWVNNQALQENTRNKEVAIGRITPNNNRVPIRLTGNGRVLNLKAGQVYNPQTGRVREARNNVAQGDSGTIGD